jgi:glutathione synthase/RimK-type ligase-like ATP-grasp enzyme
MIKIAIHHREGSFSDRWILYCKENNLFYVLVNCFDNDIITKLENYKITHLLWHVNHSSVNELMIFSSILNAAEKMNIKTFPNFNTRWHFDDKIAQKYLLESIGAPLVETTVFYDITNAKNYIKKAPFPIVAKLKRGAGSSNVELLKNKKEATNYIIQMFNTGKKSIPNTFENYEQKLRVAKKIKNPLLLFKKTINYILKNKREQLISNPEKGYVYFQKFLPDNTFDTRIILIGEIAFGIIRYNRKNDFRASGSGLIDFSSFNIDIKIIAIAFEISEKLKAQTIAFDFIYDNKTPKIIEISFGFNMQLYDVCEGYWKKDLTFIKGFFNPQNFMIEDLLNS